MTLMTHWQSMWQALGAPIPADGLFDRLIACYAEPHRKYHTLQHLNECLTHLQTLRSLAEHPAEVEFALWFHDAIYSTQSTDNEKKSAEWACSSAQSNGLLNDSATRIYDLVMVTCHRTAAISRDAAVMVDADLGILGAEPARFDEYESQIRAEYAWVPEPLYRQERRKVLVEFARRQSLYCTELFRQLFEAQARDNIARSLARL